MAAANHPGQCTPGRSLRFPGRPWDELRKRGWSVLTVELLSPGERKSLIIEYLKRYAKTLSAESAHRIATSPQTGNGLYLTTLLNELRLFGSHEELDRRIDWYLQATNPFELYGKVIQRWQKDYGKPEPLCESVVRESLIRLWAARRGLSETELLESLGTEGSPLPRALWSSLYLAAGDALANRSGLLTFSHDFLREAVREAYLPTPSDQKSAYLILATYFHGQPKGGRQLDELPWLLQRLENWQHLRDLLVDPDSFKIMFADNRLKWELYSYWVSIGSHYNPIVEYQVAADAYANSTLSKRQRHSSTNSVSSSFCGEKMLLR